MPSLIPLLDADITCYAVCFGTKPPDFLMMVERIDKQILWLESLFDFRPQVYLTGKNNFRHQISPTYKSNRKSAKPPHFYAVREYLINFWDGKVSEGCECDDVIASRQTKDTVIVSTDKDLNTVPGAHFNPTKEEFYMVSEYEAWFNFYVQMIVGDSADAVEGLAGLGKAKAPRLLADQDKDEMHQTVLELYNKQHGGDGLKIFDETYQLLYMRRDCADKLLNL